VSDISIANRLSAIPAGHAPPIRRYPAVWPSRVAAQLISGLEAILEDR
jgi:hypothetical protein